MSLKKPQGREHNTGSKTRLAMAIAAFAGASALASTSVQAAPGDALEPRFAVGQPYSGRGVSVARNSSGAFVVVWLTNNQILGRRFSSNAQPLDDGFVIDEFGLPTSPNPSLRDTSPDVAIDDAGDFVVVWSEVNYAIPTVPQRYLARVMARRYAADGHVAAAKFPVDTSIDGPGATLLSPVSFALSPSVAMNRNGRFVIGWTNTDSIQLTPLSPYSRDGAQTVLTRVFAANGVPVGRTQVAATVRVQTIDFHAPSLPIGVGAGLRSERHIATDALDVAIDADGDYAVTWVQQGSAEAFAYLTNGSLYSPRDIGFDLERETSRLLTKRYNANGIPSQLQPVLAAASAEPYSRIDAAIRRPSLAMRDDGSFVLGWSQRVGDQDRILARRFNPRGFPASDAITIAADEVFATTDLAVSDGSNGGFVAAWIDLQVPSTLKVARFAGDDTPLGGARDAGPLLVDRYTAERTGRSTLFHKNPNLGLASDQNGNFVVVIGDTVNPTGAGVFGQAFEGP